LKEKGTSRKEACFLPMKGIRTIEGLCQDQGHWVTSF